MTVTLHATDAAWLVSRDEDGQTRFLRFGTAAGGLIQWTTDEAKAIRFAREEDAAAAAIFLGLVAPAKSPAEALAELSAAVDKWAPWITDDRLGDDERAAKARAADDVRSPITIKE